MTRRCLLGSAFLAPLAARWNRPLRVAFASDSPDRQAATAAGFQSVAEDFEAALRNPSIQAIAIGASVEQQADMAIEACRARKDVWVDAPVCGSPHQARKIVEAARRYGRVVQAGTYWRCSQSCRHARRAVRRGELGGIVFCRAFEGRVSAWRCHLLDLLQFTFDGAVPTSVAVQGSGGNRLEVFRYPGFVASYERSGWGDPGIALHGVHATLVVDPRDHRARVAHWRNFHECIRSRRRPISDIETFATAWPYLTEVEPA